MKKNKTIKKIKLLDGVSWQVPELIERMRDDDFYYGYCSKNMLSSSGIKLMSHSMKKFFWIDTYADNRQALRDGWLFHTAILEPDKFQKIIFTNTLTKGVEYKELVAEHGQAKVFTKAEKNKAERLADAFYKNEKAVSLLRNSKFEEPIAGEVDGFPFRGKADVLGKNIIVDLKTTRNINWFKKDAYEKGYDIQCYLYSNLFNVDFKNFIFLAIDKTTLDIGVWNCSEDFYNSGKTKMQSALELYKEKIIGKEKDEVKEFIYNYYLEGTL
jgi:hypothetical protein